MKRRKPKKEPLSKKIIGRFDLPEDVVFDIPRISVLDNTEIRIENYKSVVEYETNALKLACKDKLIGITGKDLTICIITDDEVSIKGIVESISFLKT